MRKSSLLKVMLVVYIGLIGIIIYGFNVIKTLKEKEVEVKIIEVETCSFETLDLLPLDYSIGLITD